MVMGIVTVCTRDGVSDWQQQYSNTLIEQKSFFFFSFFLEAQKRNNAFLEGGLDPNLMSEIQSRRGSELHISVVIKANNEQVQQQRRTA